MIHPMNVYQSLRYHLKPSIITQIFSSNMNPTSTRIVRFGSLKLDISGFHTYLQIPQNSWLMTRHNSTRFRSKWEVWMWSWFMMLVIIWEDWASFLSRCHQVILLSWVMFYLFLGWRKILFHFLVWKISSGEFHLKENISL